MAAREEKDEIRGVEDEAPSVGELREGALATLLRDLVDEAGGHHGKAAEELGVNRKTLWRSLTFGLTPLMANILERRLLTEWGRERRRRRERADALDGPVEAPEQALRDDLASLRESVEALGKMLGEAQGEALRQGREQAARAEARPARETDSGTEPPATTAEAGEKVIRRPAVPPGRVYPQLLTWTPEAGEEMLYGEAMPAIHEWRRVRGQHEASASRVERLAAAVRMRELEIALIGEHELTLPPAVYPWDRFDRRDEVWRREQSLADLRAERRRAVALRWLRRVLTLGLWRS